MTGPRRARAQTLIGSVSEEVAGKAPAPRVSRVGQTS